MANSRAGLRFYLDGRNDAEEEFDPGQFNLAELATAVLEGADLRKTLHEAVEASLKMTDFDGTLENFIENYDDQLVEATGIDADDLAQRGSRSKVQVCWADWKRGYIDEAILELEDEVVEHMDELLEDEEDEDDHKPRRNASGTYGAYSRDASDDAANAWDDSNMEEYVEAVVRDAKGLPARQRKAKLRELAEAQAEKSQVDAEEDGAKDEWMDQHADDATEDHLDPEKVYTDYWRPAYVSATARLIAKHAEDLL